MLINKNGDSVNLYNLTSFSKCSKATEKNFIFKKFSPDKEIFLIVFFYLNGKGTVFEYDNIRDRDIDYSRILEAYKDNYKVLDL